MTVTIKDITDRLAKKYNLSLSAAETIGESEFAFTKEIMIKGELESVNLSRLCKIAVKPGKKNLIRKWQARTNANGEPIGYTKAEKYQGRLAKFRLQDEEDRRARLAKSNNMQQLPPQQV
jgi:hypothetical protein